MHSDPWVTLSSPTVIYYECTAPPGRMDLCALCIMHSDPWVTLRSPTVIYYECTAPPGRTDHYAFIIIHYPLSIHLPSSHIILEPLQSLLLLQCLEFLFDRKFLFAGAKQFGIGNT